VVRFSDLERSLGIATHQCLFTRHGV